MTNDLLETHLLVTAEADAVRADAHLALLSLEVLLHGASLAAAVGLATIVAGHATVGAHLVLFDLNVLIVVHGASLTADRLATEAAAAVAARHTTVRAHLVLLFDQVIVSLLLVDGAAPTSLPSLADSTVDATALVAVFTADEVSFTPGTEATFFGELVLECGCRNDHTGQQDLLKSEALL